MAAIVSHKTRYHYIYEALKACFSRPVWGSLREDKYTNVLHRHSAVRLFLSPCSGPGSDSPQVWPGLFHWSPPKRVSTVDASHWNSAAACCCNVTEISPRPNDRTHHWLMDCKKNPSSHSAPTERKTLRFEQIFAVYFLHPWQRFQKFWHPYSVIAQNTFSGYWTVLRCTVHY